MTENDIEKYIKKILDTIDADREKQIISHRFGLYDRRETLEEIGEMLGITRERVRQLEKATLAKLRAAAGKGELETIDEIEGRFLNKLKEMGNVARVFDFASQLTGNRKPSKIDCSRVAFLVELCPKLTLISENDHFHQSVTITEVHDESTVKKHVEEIIGAIKKIGEPKHIKHISNHVGRKDHKHTEALSSTSKHLASLHDLWGLIKWPVVNPKNIRDKIYVILHQHGKHMHFNEIAESIKSSEFKRKNVTTQAIHNELIKDSRFVLIGRGLYALKEWGYKKGTVADIISEVLQEAGEPLHRDEIVKRVLESRYVKETTILLNLQGKSQFKRVAKATYALSE